MEPPRHPDDHRSLSFVHPAWEGSASSRSGGRTGDDQFGFRLTDLAAPIEALHAIYRHAVRRTSPYRRLEPVTGPDEKLAWRECVRT